MRLDRLPVPPLDRPGQLEAVLDRPPHQRNECLRWRACGAEELGCDPVQGDEVVRRDRGAGVVEPPRAVGELERAEPQGSGELEAALARVVPLGGDGCERAVELLGPARSRERLQRVQSEPVRVRVECRQRSAAADVGDPAVSRCEAAGHVGDRRVRDAKQRQFGVVAELDAALLQACRDRRSDAAPTDHVDAVEHRALQFRSGYRAVAV
jgi:hypothetical protein